MLAFCWEYLSSIGTGFIDNSFVKRKVRMANQIAFLVFFPTTYMTFLYGYNVGWEQAFMTFLMAFTMGMMLVLNKVGAFRFSRVLGVLTSMLVVTYYCLVGGRLGGSQLLLIIIPVVTFGLFDYRSEKKLIFMILAVQIFLVAFLELYGYESVPAYHFEKKEINIIYGSHVVFSTLFCLIFLFVLAIDNANAEESLSQKNEQLTSLAETLSKAKEELWDNQTNLKIAKEKAEKALSVKSQFLSNMSHEMRTPLNSIIGFTQVLEGTKLDPQQKDYVRYVLKASENMLHLVNDVLDFSKFDSEVFTLNKKPVDIYELVKEVWGILHFSAESKGIFCSFQIDPEIETKVITDPLRLKQVLLNLVSNAIKFTAEGAVTINLKLVTKEIASQRIQIIIEDTGIGIDEKNHQLIFESFKQVQSDHGREYGGTGLGLAIVKRLVSALEANIQMNSELGKGTQFIIDLSLEYDKETALSTPFNWKTNPGIKNKKILVVEDNEMNQLLINKMLSQYEAQVIITSNGLEALEVLKKDKVDLLLLDLQMPGISGLEVHSKLIHDKEYQLNAKIPVVVVSADVFGETRKKAFDQGVSAFVTKPIQREELNLAIQASLIKVKVL